MDTGQLYGSGSQTLSAVRRDLITVNEKIDSIDEKVNILNRGLSPVPDRVMNVEDTMASRAQKMMELEERNKLHSAKLKLLQNEVKCEKIRSDMLMDYLRAKGEMEGNPGYKNTNYNERNTHGGYQAGDGVAQTNGTDAYASTNVGVPSSPPRNQPASPHPHNASGGYDVTQTHGQQVQKPSSPRKDPYEQRILDDEVPNRQYPIPEGQQKARGKVFNFEEMQRQRRKEIYSVYDSTAINPQFYEETPKHKKYPWFDHETHPYPGGFLFMRFDDSGYDAVNVAIKGQQSICRNAGGYLMGIARKQRIYIFEHAQSNKQQNWFVSRNQPYDDVLMTENAVATFWFTKKEAAENFFENCHHNRFREPCFPTARGYEAFYVPLQSSPTMRPFNTFLFIEILLNPTKRDGLQENMTQFEAELRNDMTRVIPCCQPMVVSSTGRVIFKPGLFVSPYSKLFISRFEAQRDVDQIWKMGMIQALRQKWGLTGEMNVFSLTIQDAF